MSVEKNWLDKGEGEAAVAPERRVDAEARIGFGRKVADILTHPVDVSALDESWIYFRPQSYYTFTKETDAFDVDRMRASNEVAEAARAHGIENVKMVREEDGRLSVYYHRLPKGQA